MKHHWACAVAVMLLLAVTPSAALSAVTRPAVDARRQADGITTAILISTEETRRQVERSEATIRTLYKRLENQATQTQAALDRANLSEQERRGLDEELGRLREGQKALIAQLSARDAEYAAGIRAYREGLTGLLAENDPRIVAMLKLYADGDARAADELQELTRIIVKSRDAGTRARNGADLRTVARIWLNEKDKGAKTTSQALAAWQEAASIDPADFRQWIEISRLQTEAGNLTCALEAALRAKALANDQGELAFVLESMGNIAVLQEKPEDARAAFEQLLRLSRALLEANPSGTRERSNVGVALSYLGLVALDQAQEKQTQAKNRLFDEARNAFEEAIKIDRALLSENPNRTDLKRSLSVSLGHIGSLRVAQRRLDDARKAFAESAEIRRAMLEANPTSEGAKILLSSILTGIAKVAVAQGRLEDARAAYDESVRIRRAVLAANPSNAEAKHQLSITLAKVAQLAYQDDRMCDARAAYEESYLLSQSLLVIDPSNESVSRQAVASSLGFQAFCGFRCESDKGTVKVLAVPLPEKHIECMF